MDLAALVHGIRAVPLQGGREPLVLVADDVAHAVEPALGEVAEDGAPGHGALGVADPTAEILAIPIGAHAEDPEHRGGAHLALASDALVVGVDDEVGHRLRIEATGAPGRQGGVEPLGGRTDEGGTDGLAAERLDDAADLAGRDALEVARGERREEGLLVALVAREHGGLEERGAIARDLEREAPDASDEGAGARAVADAAAGGASGVASGTEEGGEVALEDGLHFGGDHLAEGVGVGAAEGRELGRPRRGRGGLQEAMGAIIVRIQRNGHRSASGQRGASPPLVMGSHPEDGRWPFLHLARRGSVRPIYTHLRTRPYQFQLTVTSAINGQLTLTT